MAEDGVEGDNFGSAIAIDGDIMVIAAPWANLGDLETSGIVYLFRRDTEINEWVMHQQLIPAQGHFEDNFLDMTLAIDGNTIAVGAYYADVDQFQEGVVYIFEPDTNGDWVQIARLADASVGFNGHFGTSLALNGDLLAIGSPQETQDRHGRVDIFQRDHGGENNWGRITTLYGYANFASAVDDGGHVKSFGSAVVLNHDQLIVGSSRASVSFNNMNDGAAYVFQRNVNDPEQWDYINRIIAPGSDQCVNGLKLSEFNLQSTVDERIEAQRCAQEDINTRHDNFGSAMVLHGDLLVIGARTAEYEGSGELTGAVYLFQQDQDDLSMWRFLHKFQGSISGISNFGNTLAMTEDTLIVGASTETIDDVIRQGAAYVFERDNGMPETWDLTEKLTSSDGLSSTNFGEAVALDGITRFIGAHGYLGRRGAVYIHEPETAPLPDNSCAPAFDNTGELIGTNVLTAESGVILGATPGALSTSVSAWIHEVPTPIEPLFDNAQTHGAFYNVGSECETVAPLESPFIVGLPVPEGVEFANLGVAVLGPEGSLLDASLTGRFWQPVSGSYDAGQRLYMISMGALMEAGHTVVLIEHPDLGPFSITFSPAPTQPIGASVVSTAPGFHVQCFGISSGCGVAEEVKVQIKLLEAYAKFNSQGFPPPALDSTEIIHFYYGSGFGVYVSQYTRYKQIYIRTQADPVCQEKGVVKGFYDPNIANGTLSICIDPATGFPDDDDLAETIAHELFHATQFAYEKVRVTPYDDWVIEGTAETAIYSEQEMFRRDKRELRNVSTQLTHKRGASGKESQYPYETQDFWVHLMRSTNSFGIKRNFNLGVLNEFFEQGGTTDSVADYLADPGDLAFDDLGTEYWIWVKNQVAEKTDVTLDGALENPCKLDGRLINTAKAFTYPATDREFDSLLPLQSELVKITLYDPENPEQVFDSVRVFAEGENLNYKVYLAQDVDTDPTLVDQNCTEIPDGDEIGRSFEQLPPNSIVYVLLSQLSYNDDVVPPLYEVRVDREAIP